MHVQIVGEKKTRHWTTNYNKTTENSQPTGSHAQGTEYRFAYIPYNLIRICFITIFKPSVYLRKQRSTSDVYVERDIVQRGAHDIKKEFSAGQPMFNFSSSKTFS